jgi:hypothetical protein
MRHAGLLLIAPLAFLAGCSAASPTVEECEALCARQGKTVSEYRVGAQVPLFKPAPTVACVCA